MKTLGIDFETLFDTLPEQYVIFDVTKPGYRMVAASNRYLTILGKTKEEVINHGLFEVFPDTSELAKTSGKGELETSLEKVIATEKPDSTGVIRYDIEDDTGKLQLRYWQATHYPIRKDGKCVAILQSTADITELAQSNKKLELANLKLENALKAGLIGSWSWDISKNTVIADKGLARIFGVSVEEAIAGLPLETFIQSIYVDDREVVTEAIQVAITTGELFEVEYRTIDSDKTIHWVIARGQAELDENGHATQFPGVMIDISSRKEAEAVMSESEQRLRFMADTMPQLVWITRADGYHEYYNKHWYEFTGTTEGETDGEGWKDLFHVDDQKRANKVWKKSLKTGEPYEIKYRLYNAASGEYRWVIGRALPFRNDANEIIKWYGTCTDVDDSVKEIEKRKKLEEDLKRERDSLEERINERTMQLKLTNDGLRDEIKKRRSVEARIREYSKELKRSNQELEEFAYVSSHDLQEPLRKIQAFSGLLVEEYGEKLDDGREYLDRINKSASRMSTLIEDLLTFSRVTTKPSTPSRVDLNETVKNVISDLSARLEKENGTIDIVSTLPVVLADQTHMHQLMQNLLSNGLKFHKQDVAPTIVVDSEQSDDTVTITVSDNGIGIDPKYKDKVFAVFQRLNTKQQYDGTGIGLAVCKKIVERYNGTISLESKLGVGTKIIITLPNAKEE